MAIALYLAKTKQVVDLQKFKTLDTPHSVHHAQHHHVLLSDTDYQVIDTATQQILPNYEVLQDGEDIIVHNTVTDDTYIIEDWSDVYMTYATDYSAVPSLQAVEAGQVISTEIGTAATMTNAEIAGWMGMVALGGVALTLRGDHDDHHTQPSKNIFGDTNIDQQVDEKDEYPQIIVTANSAPIGYHTHITLPTAGGYSIGDTLVITGPTGDQKTIIIENEEQLTQGIDVVLAPDYVDGGEINVTVTDSTSGAVITLPPKSVEAISIFGDTNTDGQVNDLDEQPQISVNTSSSGYHTHITLPTSGGYGIGDKLVITGPTGDQKTITIENEEQLTQGIDVVLAPDYVDGGEINVTVTDGASGAVIALPPKSVEAISIFGDTNADGQVNDLDEQPQISVNTSPSGYHTHITLPTAGGYGIGDKLVITGPTGDQKTIIIENEKQLTQGIDVVLAPDYADGGEINVTVTDGASGAVIALPPKSVEAIHILGDTDNNGVADEAGQPQLTVKDSSLVVTLPTDAHYQIGDVVKIAVGDQSLELPITSTEELQAFEAGKEISLSPDVLSLDNALLTVEVMRDDDKVTAQDYLGDVVLAGEAQKGSILTATLKDLDNFDSNAVQYQWFADGEPIVWANSNSNQLSLTEDLVGHKISVQVIYTDIHGVQETVTSNSTDPILNVNDTIVVTIEGRSVEGETLTATTPDTVDNPTYQWYADNQPIKGATTATYTLGQQDVGKSISVQTMYEQDGTAFATPKSQATDVVANVNDDAVVTIKGTAKQGETLTAAIADEDGVPNTGVSYTWYADGVKIPNATTSTYQLTQAEVGKAITVEVNYIDAFNKQENQTSLPTAQVENSDDAAVFTLSKNGEQDFTTVQEGDVLTAHLQDNDGASNVQYQWYAGDTPISGATNATYTLMQTEVGKQIKVVATYTDGFDNQTTSEEYIVPGTVANVNDAGTISISGIAQQGEILTANINDEDGVPSNVTYHWYANGEEIPNAIGSTYQLTQAEVGKAITVEASYTDVFGNQETTPLSAATNPVVNVDDPAELTVNRTDSNGDHQLSQGDVLTADFSDPDGASNVQYQWYAGDTPISGATDSSYTLTQAEVGKQIKLVVTYTDEYGAQREVVQINDTVANIDDPAELTVNRTDSNGDSQLSQGDVLTATLKDADGASNVQYQWYAGDTPISGATNATYTLKQDEVGKQIKVVATYTDGFDNQTTGEEYIVPGTVANVNDTGTISISGVAQAGKTLTAKISDKDGVPSDVTYRWYADSEEIPNATGSTYQLTQAEVGKTITVTAQYTDTFNHPEQITSTATATVVAADAVPPLVISGDAVQGQTLQANFVEGATPPIGTTVTYRWYADGVLIDGQNGSTLTLQEAQVGKTITVEAVYTDATHGTVTTPQSTATAAVENVDEQGSITISSGTAQQGETLTATVTDADGENNVSYQWLRNGTMIAGSDSYHLTQDDVGQEIKVIASYTDNYGVQSTATTTIPSISNVDDQGIITLTKNNGETATTVQEGDLLTANLQDADGASNIQYQWLRNGTKIAEGESYRLTQNDVGQNITVKAIYIDGFDQQENSSSIPLPTVSNINNLGKISISGTTKQGETLTANIADADGVPSTDVTYYWYADGVQIPNATGSTYQLTQAEVGKAITVEASYIDNFNQQETPKFTATAVVANVNDPGAISISGTAKEDETLTATATDADGVNNVSYQWFRDGQPIDKATTSTFTLTQDDVGHEIKVIANYTDNYGVKSTATTTIPSISNVDDKGVITLTKNNGETATTVQEGDTLTATLHDADGVPSNVTYTWYAVNTQGEAQPIGTGNQLLLTQTYANQQIKVIASYTDVISKQSVTSDPVIVGPVADINNPGSVTITKADGTAATALKQNDIVRATVSDIDGSNNISYQWYLVDGSTETKITGATSQDFQLNQSTVGKQVKVKVTYTDSYGEQFAESQQILPPNSTITNVNDEGTISISGTAKQGETLTAHIADADGVPSTGVTYTWYANGEEIPNATGSTYQLTQAEVGKAITVKAVYTDLLGSPEATQLSAATDKVNDIATVQLSGDVAEGKTLTATINDANGVPTSGITYTWTIGNTQIIHTDDNTLLLDQDSYVGQTVKVTASYTDLHNHTESVMGTTTQAVAEAKPSITVVTDATGRYGTHITGKIQTNFGADGAATTDALAVTLTITQQADSTTNIMNGTLSTANDTQWVFTFDNGNQGTLTVNRTTGEFEYTGVPTTGNGAAYQFAFTVKDADGDTANATTTATLLAVPQPIEFVENLQGDDAKHNIAFTLPSGATFDGTSFAGTYGQVDVVNGQLVYTQTLAATHSATQNIVSDTVNVTVKLANGSTQTVTVTAKIQDSTPTITVGDYFNAGTINIDFAADGMVSSQALTAQVNGGERMELLPQSDTSIYQTADGKITIDMATHQLTYSGSPTDTIVITATDADGDAISQTVPLKPFNPTFAYTADTDNVQLTFELPVGANPDDYKIVVEGTQYDVTSIGGGKYIALIPQSDLTNTNLATDNYDKVVLVTLVRTTDNASSQPIELHAHRNTWDLTSSVKNWDGLHNTIEESNSNLDTVWLLDGQEWYGISTYDDYGSSYSETLNETILTSGSGNDTYIISGQNDGIYSRNTIVKTTVDSGAGSDTFIITGNDDSAIEHEWGANGSITVNSGAGDDILTLTGGNYALETKDGSITVDSGDGDDTMTFNARDEYAIITRNATATVRVIGGAGSDTIAFQAGWDAINNSGATIIDGGSGVDSITLTATDEGIDNTGTITIDGGTGSDTIILQVNRDAIYNSGVVKIYGETDGNDSGSDNTITLTGGQDAIETQSSGNTSIVSGSGVDTITLTATDEAIENSGTTIINSGAGSDVISLTSNNSNAIKNTGTTTINGFAGNDRITITSTTAAAISNSGTTTVSGDDGNDTISLTGTSYAIENSGTATINGGVGNDAIALNGTTNAIKTGSGTTTILGEAGDDTMSLSSILTTGWSGGKTILDSGADNDTITMTSVTSEWSGTTEILSGDGDDRITLTGAATAISNSSTTTIDSGIGNDVISLSGTSYAINNSGGTATINGGVGNDAITLNGTTNAIKTSSGTTTILGEAGDDTINLSSILTTGWGSKTVLDSGADNDTVTITSVTTEWSGKTVLDGGIGDDTLALSTGSYTVFGNTSTSGATYIVNFEKIDLTDSGDVTLTIANPTASTDTVKVYGESGDKVQFTNASGWSKGTVTAIDGHTFTSYNYSSGGITSTLLVENGVTVNGIL